MQKRSNASSDEGFLSEFRNKDRTQNAHTPYTIRPAANVGTVSEIQRAREQQKLLVRSNRMPVRQHMRHNDQCKQNEKKIPDHIQNVTDPTAGWKEEAGTRI